MTTIYAVTRGKYSDHRIVAMFDEYEKAKEFIDYFDECISFNDFNDIEEYALNPDSFDLIRNGYKPWYVLMLKNGDTEKVYEKDSSLFHNIESAMTTEACIWPRSTAPAFIGQKGPDCLKVNCLAKDRKHAVKIANEKRIQFLSMGWWNNE